MKKIFTMILCCCILLSLTACGEEPAPIQDATTSSPTTQAATVPSTTATEATEPISSAVYSGALAAITMPVITETETDANGTIISYYSYPDVSVTLPDGDVAQVIELDLLNRIDSTSKAAEQIHAAAKSDYSGQDDWYNYFLDVSYTVERLDQNVLSLYGKEAAFDGSPSSATVGVSVNYDLTTGSALTLQSIMYADFSADVLSQLIVEGLSSYEESTLFQGYEDVIDQMFSTNIPVESWYFSNTGLCFYFAPYEIAPNAMGIIVSEIPYSALSGLMKDAYFPTEELVYSGSVQAEAMTGIQNETLKNYAQFGELSLGDGGQKYLLTVSGSVLNLRIHALTKDGSGNHIAGKMLYATAGMGPTDAVIMDLPTDCNGLYFVYESNGKPSTTLFSLPAEQ